LKADYTYDGLERLALRTTQNMTPAGTTHYVYDLAGHLIAEASDTGATLREYVWLDELPLAVVADVDTMSPNLYFVHADHLDRPIKMTDGGKAVVWDAVYRPFGEAHSIAGSAANNLRFPGQYFLIESGLHYNWHRHYDPTLGRYTQPDPLRDVISWAVDSGLSRSGNVGSAFRSYLPQHRHIPDLGGAISPDSASIADGAAEIDLSDFADGPSRYAYATSAPTVHIDPSGLMVAHLAPLNLASANNVMRVLQKSHFHLSR
jgi:RHS repeat-associated protein